MNDADVLSWQVKEFATHWFRDADGVDNTEVNGISIGSTLSYLIWQATASILRYSLQFESTQQRGEAPTIKRDATRLEHLVAREFKVTEQDPTRRSFVPQLDEQVISKSMITVPCSARTVQRIQAVFNPLIDFPEHLWITDWLTSHTARNDPRGTVLYRKSLLRSAIPHISNVGRLQAESNFPSQIEDLFSKERLSTFVERQGYEWPSYVLNAIYHYVHEIYSDIRELLVTASAQILSMLNFYSPSTVFLPGDAIETWNLWYQFCNLQNVKTVMYMDGYAIIPIFPLLKDASNSSWLVNRVAAYGSGQAEMYRRYGYPSTQLEVVKPPFVFHQQSLRPQRNTFDAIVLTWTPLNLNPTSDSHSPVTTLATVLKVLNRCGKKKIAVKVRWPGEVLYVKNVLKNLGSDAVVLEGFLWHHLSKSSLFVGGISTALAEVTAAGGKYIIFEPEENGYTDLELQKAVVISRKTVARSAEELEVLVRRGESSWIGDPASNLLA